MSGVREEGSCMMFRNTKSETDRQTERGGSKIQSRGDSPTEEKELRIETQLKSEEPKGRNS
jgi:hypothetical protein